MLSKSEIQHVKSLRTKKFRQKYNQFVVEGEKAVAELLQTDFIIDSVYGLEEWGTKYLHLINGVEYIDVKQKELERISGFGQPNKVLAVVNIPENDFSDTVLQQPLTIALDFIQDPGNLGTIIRTADWYGIEHILCSENCVDTYSPKVINATMGSFIRVKVHYVNLEEVLQNHASQVYACAMDGENVYDTTPAKNAIVLVGNEGKGISDNLLALAKSKISIPRKGKAESLNAAVATAVIVDVLGRKHP